MGFKMVGSGWITSKAIISKSIFQPLLHTQLALLLVQLTLHFQPAKHQQNTIK